jgi:hypothetical protein
MAFFSLKKLKYETLRGMKRALVTEARQIWVEKGASVEDRWSPAWKLPRYLSTRAKEMSTHVVEAEPQVATTSRAE